MSTLAVGTLRLPRRPGGGVPDPEPVLEAIVPRAGDHRVLIVRRLHIRLADPAGARDEVEAVRRRAARPGTSAACADAEAVEFADEAEALLCLTRDVVMGVAQHRWWWARRLPSYCHTPGETLAVLWTRHARLVPTVLTEMAATTPDDADRTLGVLGTAASTVLAAVLAEYPGQEAPALDAPATGDPAVDPGAQLRAVSASITGRSAPTHGTGSAGVPEERGLPTRNPVPAGMSEPPDSRPHPADKSRGDAEVADLREERARRRSHPAPPHEDASGVPPLPPWTGSGPATDSQLATLLYAINLVRRFDLDEQVESPGTGWAVVEAVGRNLLRTLPAKRRRELLADPLLSLLADLDGRPDGGPTPVRLGAAMRPVHQWIAEHDVRATVFTQPGRVLVSHTHVDVVMDLETIDLTARVNGLDQDPGWVPSLGRIVLFHFEEA